MEVCVNRIPKSLTRVHVSALLLGLVLMVGAAVPAAAQGLEGTSTAAIAATDTYSPAGSGFVRSLPADVTFLAPDQARPGTSNTPTHTMGGKQVVVMVQGGLITCCSNTGFLIGAGASVKPMPDNDKFEVGGDVNFGRIGGSNSIYVSLHGQYDIHLQNSKAVPFVGGGIGIVHFGGQSVTVNGVTVSGGGATNTNLELLGGVDFETGGG